MELKQVIARRRSIRRFYPTEVPQEDILQILESARLCQSACNRQPWRLMVLTGAMKRKVAETMIQWVEDHPGVANDSAISARIIRQAPVLIMVLREKDDFWKHFDDLSIGAAIEHMCLTAFDLGLGALWIGHTAYAETDILKVVGREDMELPSVVAIGYPAEEPPMRPRLSLEEILIEPKV